MGGGGGERNRRGRGRDLPSHASISFLSRSGKEKGFDVNIEELSNFPLKSMSMRGPGSGDTCHLTDFNETWLDLRAHQITSKAKVVWYLEFSGGS